MKKLFFFILIFFEANLYSQTETFQIAPKNTISVHVAPYEFMVIGKYQRINGNNYSFNMGINYSRELTERWSFCSGFEQRTVAQKWEDDNIVKDRYKRNILNLPVAFKYYFSIPVHIQFGANFAFWGYDNKNSDYVFAFGHQLSAGWEHVLNNGITISINSNAIWYPINPKYPRFINRDPNEFFRGGFLFFGINMGIGYKF